MTLQPTCVHHLLPSLLPVVPWSGPGNSGDSDRDLLLLARVKECLHPEKFLQTSTSGMSMCVHFAKT